METTYSYQDQQDLLQGAIEVPANYAGFSLRVAAAILDGIIFYPVQLIIYKIAGLPLFDGGLELFKSPAYYLVLLLGVAYYTLMESSKWQATLGKKAVGIVVTDLDGNRISFGKALGRYFAKIISAIILCIGFMMAGFTEKKQALHDMIAGTLVVKR